MRAFAIISVMGGTPDINTVATPVKGWAQVFQIDANWGVYLVSGTGPQLVALNATAQVTGICSVSENASSKYPELDDIIAPAVRTKLNTRLSALGKGNIPAGWTNRQIMSKMYEHFNNNPGRTENLFDTDIAE